MGDETRRRPLSRRAWIGIVLAVAAVIFLALDAAGAFLIVADAIIKADAVVVLSGGGVERARTAAELFHSGHAAWFVFTEAGLNLSGSSQTSTDLNFDQAASLGVPREAILITRQPSTSTEDEARSVRAMAGSRGWASILVVTDPYHTRRAGLIFKREFAGTGIRVAIRPAANHWYRSLTWWLSANGWRETILEYGKLAHYLYTLQE